MRAMLLRRLVRLREEPSPLELVVLSIPEPSSGEVLVKVSACGVCHTELDEIEGRTAPATLPVIPGHEVIGYVERVGADVTKRREGERVGVGWIHSSSGGVDENLSPEFRATGRDVNGGYAEYMTVPEDYCYPIPRCFSDAQAAPLLCAGAVGYRALKLSGLADGQALGLTGFGGSGHLVLQTAVNLFPRSEVYVFARDPGERRFARELGAVWAGDTKDEAPVKLHAVIDTTPAWKPVVEALKNLRPAGRLVINAIRKEDIDKESLLDLNYHEHLWMEREIKTVANVTSHDIREFLQIAADIPLHPTVQTYELEDANRALVELREGSVRGAKVLVISPTSESKSSRPGINQKS